MSANLIDLDCFAGFVDTCRAGGRQPDECSTTRMAA